MPPVVLCILDGWGFSEETISNAPVLAKTPNFDHLWQTCPKTKLLTHGLDVGLPKGQMGNSEVGHMNIGAGRIISMDLGQIDLEIENENFFKNEALLTHIRDIKDSNGRAHLIGLFSNGGVHGHINHLIASIRLFHSHDVPVILHLITDGRDVDPKSGKGYIERLEKKLNATGGKLASITGRYYAMDRDKRWERIKKAYDALIYGKGTPTKDFKQQIQSSYDQGVTDEFIEPMIAVNEKNLPITKINSGDVIVFFNYRTDRGRQLTEALSQVAFPKNEMVPLDLHYVTLTNYDKAFKKVNVVIEKDNKKDTLGETLARAGKSQIRIAETEKYPHVTFFFNGGREKPFNGESRIMCPSPKVSTYDLQPEMSAFDVRDSIIPRIENDTPDFICLNFANPDMVGHTGDLNAAIKACETVDHCAGNIIEAALKQNYKIIIISDHGNCETMINEDGSPNTAHTTNPVPIILVDIDFTTINNGVLGDIAPTILKLMSVDIPKSMTGNPLV